MLAKRAASCVFFLFFVLTALHAQTPAAVTTQCQATPVLKALPWIPIPAHPALQPRVIRTNSGFSASTTTRSAQPRLILIPGLLWATPLTGRSPTTAG